VETAGKLKEHYIFTEEDEQNLLRLKPFMEEEKLRVGDELYRYILSIPEISPYLSDDDEARKRHRAGLGRWFSALFSGRYDQVYFLDLQRIGTTHVRIELKGHYVNAAMNTVRGLCREVVNRNFVDAEERAVLSTSLDKILDMNLDVITGSYRDAEMRKVFLSYRLDETLLGFAERFSSALKIVLVAALMGISIAVVGLFVSDVARLFHNRTAHGVLGALGSLLIIWVMVELMENEIRQLRGGNFKIQVFLGVALVALIRELLIASLEHSSGEAQLSILAGIVSLGVVYWLISRADALPGRR
jgi:uncharacterized membrane protein (DUF373 family)